MNETTEFLARSKARVRVEGHSSAHLNRAHSQLHQLKRKLLRSALEETPETGLFKGLGGAANRAEELAWATSYPLLLFPCLFEAMIQVVRERFQQEQISDVAPSFTSLDADPRFEGFHSASRGSRESLGGGWETLESRPRLALAQSPAK